MTQSSFGEHLKREREMRGVSLEEISSATRIGTRFLEALENEQWDRLPGGVFNRGFVRAVARFLGLDEENLVAEYALATNDRPPTAADLTATTSQRNGLRWLPWLAVLLVVLAAAWFVWHRYGPSGVGRHRSSSQAAPTAAPPSPQDTGRPTGTTAAATTAVAFPQGQPPGSPATPASSSSAVAEPAALELKVEAGKTTEVSVLADGKSVYDGKISAGQSQRFQAKERFEISTRNSSALFLELNGQTVAPIGPPGRPGRVTLSRQDLSKPAGGRD